jgi:hypothetical protein
LDATKFLFEVKMKNQKEIIIPLLFSLVSISATAGFWDGNKLLSDINSETYSGKALALGYVIGVHDSFDTWLFCTPENSSQGQLRDVVKKYIENNPAIRHKSADTLIVNALQQSFPCPKK